MGSYDDVVVDTPPNLGLLTVNALLPADVVLAPVSAEDEGSAQGLAELNATFAKLEDLRGSSQPRLVVLITRWQEGRLMAQAVEEAVAGRGFAIAARIPAHAAVQAGSGVAHAADSRGAGQPGQHRLRGVRRRAARRGGSAMNGRPVLELDDPLAPRRPAIAPAPEPVATGGDEHPPAAERPPRRRVRPPRPEPVAESSDGRGEPLAVVGESSSAGRADGAWRHWAGGTRVASYRLPDELLEELDARARRLGVPIGMTVAAGLLELFDQDDETVIRLVERAEDARVLGRRSARRRT